VGVGVAAAVEEEEEEEEESYIHNGKRALARGNSRVGGPGRPGIDGLVLATVTDITATQKRGVGAPGRPRLGGLALARVTDVTATQSDSNRRKTRSRWACSPQISKSKSNGRNSNKKR
jgi:hypothetical protein